MSSNAITDEEYNALVERLGDLPMEDLANVIHEALQLVSTPDYSFNKATDTGTTSFTLPLEHTYLRIVFEATRRA